MVPESSRGNFAVVKSHVTMRPTQIETKENNKQKENTPEEQEIKECDYTNTRED